MASRRSIITGTGTSIPEHVVTNDALADVIHQSERVLGIPVPLHRRKFVPLRGLPEIDYPFHDRDVIVTHCGRICMHRKKINISTVMAGQKLGIKEVDDAIWLVTFMHYDLGYIDLEQRTLQTIDNPFGTRLSPMS